MSTSASSDPFAQLKDIERRSRVHALGLPRQEQARKQSVGLGFRMGADLFMAPSGSVSEMLKLPPLTRVPGVKPWVKGIANIRGRLVPLVDVRGCMGGGMSEVTEQSRVLIVQHADSSTGVLVDEILGLKHFLEEERSAVDSAHSSYLDDYIDGAFVQDEVRWIELNIGKLVSSTAFLQAGQ
jgi:twitching motility protein PilI